MRKKETMDGNTAAAYISYAFTELAAIYPITPSSTMAELVDEWASVGRQNLFGQPVKVVEMQSEAGAAGVLHGSLKTGALSSTYTASQGLLLMIPDMYKMAGELLPAVFHVAARAVTSNALSIFGDHSDVMAARQTGVAMLAESSVQEVMDLTAVAHLAAIEGRLPFINFFDGFRTSHEIQKIEVIDYEELAPLLNQKSLAEFKNKAMNPNHPTVSGTNQPPEIFFQQRETVNSYYDQLPAMVSHYMEKINELRGTNYDLVNYYGDPEATEVIISMGSVGPIIEQTVDYLRKQGRKVGFLNIHLYRPFPIEKLLSIMPNTVEKIAVLDRTKEPGAGGEPLLLDVQSAFYDAKTHPVIIGGRYGLGSKDVLPNHIVAVYDELAKSQSQMKTRFTVGIDDDLTHLSLPQTPILDLTNPQTFQAKFWGFGSDGTVGANKSAIKIIGNNTDKFAQGYFYYDSKKSGGLTVSHLRFGDTPIRSSYLIEHADFIACHTASYLHLYDLTKGLKPGGTFLLNTVWNDQQLAQNLPAKLKKYLAENQIQFYTIDAVSLAQNLGLGRRINTAMETAFFKLAEIIPFEEVLSILKESAQKAYGKKSQAIVEKNIAAIDGAVALLHRVDVPEDWAQAVEIQKELPSHLPKFFYEISEPVNALEGESISVKDLADHGLTEGAMPVGTTQYEKRGIALEVPEWNADFCIQCNECAFVCPHAAIRPFLANEKEMEEAPEGFIVKTMKGSDGLLYRIQVSIEDCTGCGLCVEACPKAGAALKMMPYETQKEEAMDWAFAMTLNAKENPIKNNNTVLATQFNKPLFEFSSACSGCGETPYLKLLTQMFGDRMMISNATGCSSIYGGSFPVTPYTKNDQGQGPAWSNSLFEDNAEFGFGMYLANQTRREKLAQDLIAYAKESSEEIQVLISDWLEHFSTGEGTRQRAEKLLAALTAENEQRPTTHLLHLLEQKDQFAKPSQWLIGGDGWAYDIGFGGIDHVLATGEDVNILVLDNEVYANTGGQTSKATPTSAIAKFASSGKYFGKKDLGMMAMSYGNIYVAQIASGANQMQTIRAFEEAEKFPGPSLIIAYVPCINHGLKAGMSQTLAEAKEAVESGYWSLYRYNPLLEENGKVPMVLDFKKPDFSLMPDFMRKQTRFSALETTNPDQAGQLFAKTVSDAKRRFYSYARLTGQEEKIRQRIEKNEQKVEVVESSSTEGNTAVDEKEARRLARRAKRHEKE
ncbi:pyruvate:ferredoxin (flavodoxin) oxidoreductase [Enterococcus timonensis]|uniref:pyruvate:ferredoxin (flavodoxin) oxidoreductase n=1 Tax=Enterococcus timonensis TaxID=1852364 RepID=UPI0008D98D17|nr:pyruvate:ferredoxin (flavodoxin) oxidoreductase [Enterococcus timonensis]